MFKKVTMTTQTGIYGQQCYSSFRVCHSPPGNSNSIQVHWETSELHEERKHLCLHRQRTHASNLCNILLLLQRHIPTTMCIPYRSICCTSQNTETVIQTQITAAFFSECNRWINMSLPSHSGLYRNMHTNCTYYSCYKGTYINTHYNVHTNCIN